ncbi:MULTISPECIES: hydantoinase/oxoprolinase family protein [unclassified Oleiphilus]|uniref:hydantoinase/oxoprolinase family protein n=2 Tax=Oleiphilus TaxID=141450 RepID=UPI000A507C54|nr:MULTISPECIES: hydantoinase/oxoprolinase family protein [unclassified Oleiphilus]
MSTKLDTQIKHLGIDAGGTFTDFVLVHENGSLETHKVLSTPENPAEAIIQGVRELGVDSLLDKGAIKIIHGSTVATNAALEGKGARTAYVTNKGFRDVLTIGRQNRKELYNLSPTKSAPPVPREYCLEVDCRRDATGKIIQPLADADIDNLVYKIKQLGVEAIAINLLFSFLNDDEERRLERALKPFGFVSRSSFVLPVYKEYERGIATWLNASLGPKVSQYLSSLQTDLSGCDAFIMQSSGGLLTLDQAKNRAVNLLLSGPAGGLSAVRLLGKKLKKPRILSFDMGGTSTDVSLMNGDFKLSDEAQIANWPVAVPMLDMATIGAGGGSIAWIDDAGMLHVGPESAGSKPGPACYGLGGELATVTDANLVSGRLPRSAKLGGSLDLNFEAAETAIRNLAEPLGLSVEETAKGIIQIAEQQMVAALHNISVKQGHAPKDFVLCCFGGAGGMHVCSLADQLNMTSAIIPRNAGVLSAFGMLTAPLMRTSTRSHIKPFGDISHSDLETMFERMQQEIRLESPELVSTGYIKKHLDLRYLGQSYTIEVGYNANSAELFEKAHEQRFGHRLDKPLELVNLKLSVEGEASIQSLGTWNAHQTNEYKEENGCKIYSRERISANTILSGPAIITEAISTTWIPDGWTLETDQFGNLILTRL